MKDPAAMIGVGVGFAVILVANVLEGGNPMSLVEVAPILLVLGTTTMVTVAGGSMADAKAAVKNLKRAFTTGVAPANDLVPQVVQLAERARREGLLALEDALKDIPD
ncbi:MAG TPA: motility protein A, partial [Nocardioides sp.]|nr:motility protein A [Nocardioides sp.]